MRLSRIKLKVDIIFGPFTSYTTSQSFESVQDASQLSPLLGLILDRGRSTYGGTLLTLDSSNLATVYLVGAGKEDKRRVVVLHPV